MNYQKIYDAIIEKAKSKNRKKIRKNQKDYVYYENHHIIPKCIGGGEEKENKVLLTAKEHYVCHKLLTCVYPNNYRIVCAFFYMTFSKRTNKHIKSSRDYVYARELFTITDKPEETRKKISKKAKERGMWCGILNPNFKNKTFNNDKNKLKNRIIKLQNNSNWKTNISKAHLGKKLSKEHIESLRNADRSKWKISEQGLKNIKDSASKPKSETHKKHISEAKKGKTLSKEHRQKIGDSTRGKTFEERFGIEKAKKIKENASILRKGKKPTKETKLKMSLSAKKRKRIKKLNNVQIKEIQKKLIYMKPIIIAQEYKVNYRIILNIKNNNY